jgi:hypothetical protein
LPWHEYINLELGKVAALHTSGAAFLIIGFTLIELLIRLISLIISVPEAVLKYVKVCESIVMVAGITWLAAFVLYELAVLSLRLWKGQKFLATFVG